MAQTTTQFSAKDAQIYLDDAGGDLVELSGSLNKVELDRENKIGEFETFQSDFPVRSVGKKDASLSMDFVASTATDEGKDILDEWYHGGDDSPRTVRVDVPDSSVGSTRYEGEFLLETLNMPLDASDANPVMIKAAFKPSGQVTKTTITS